MTIKKLSQQCLAALLMLVTLPALAANVAVVDFQFALLNSESGRAAAQEPQAQVRLMEQRLAEEKQSLQNDINEFQRNELTLSVDEANQQKQQLAQREQQLRNMAASMQRQAQKMEQDLLKQLQPAGEAALKALIAERQLDLVLSRQAAVFANETVDITQALMQKLNETN